MSNTGSPSKGKYHMTHVRHDYMERYDSKHIPLMSYEEQIYTVVVKMSTKINKKNK